MGRRETPDVMAGLGQPADDALGLAMGPQVMALDIAVIRLDGGTQPRAGIDQAVVEDYANDMEANGAEFPPVQVVYDGEAYWLWDGFHRLHARKRNGLYTAPAIVRQGTRRDAVLLSVGANATHGFRRTNEDKRRAVLALLHDEEWVQWSDREIARRCAVSNQFVSNVRAQLSVNGGQIETRRVQRNGTEYTMAPPQRTPAPAVAAQGATWLSLAELTTQVRAWADVWEEPVQALRGLNSESIGREGNYWEDWMNWVEGKYSAGMLGAAVGAVLGEMDGGMDGMDGMDGSEVEPAALRAEPARVAPMGLDTPKTATRPAEGTREVIGWRQMRGQVTEDGRVLVQMQNGTKNPPWLELDDAGQHWMLDLIRQAQEVRQ